MQIDVRGREENKMADTATNEGMGEVERKAQRQLRDRKTEKPEPADKTNFSTWGTGVNIRSGPSTGFDVVRTLEGPTEVKVDCQQAGEEVTAAGYSNHWWSHLPEFNGWITNIFIDHPASKLPGVPECDAATKEHQRKHNRTASNEGTGKAEKEARKGNSGDDRQEDTSPTPSPSPDPSPYSVVDDNGDKLADGDTRTADRKGLLDDLPPDVTRMMLLNAVNVVAPGSITNIPIANGLGWTVAIGIQGQIAEVVGGSVEGGIYFGPHGSCGLYKSLAMDVGWILGATASACYTAVDGPASKLGGKCHAFTLSGGPGVASVGGAILFEYESWEFLGVMGMVSVGLGSPFNLSYTYTESGLVPLAKPSPDRPTPRLGRPQPSPGPSPSPPSTAPTPTN